MVTLSVREALRDAMAEEMRRDDRVFVMGEEVAQYQGAYKVTQGLLDEFGPERVIDTPLAEALIAGMAIGMAAEGLKTVAEIQFSGFAYATIDQILADDEDAPPKQRHTAAQHHHLDVFFRPRQAADFSGHLVGQLARGAQHHRLHRKTPRIQVGQQRNAEGCRFAAAGLGLGNQVFAQQRNR